MQAPTAESWSPGDHLRHFAYRGIWRGLTRHLFPDRSTWSVLDFGAEWYGDPDGGFQSYMRWMLKDVMGVERMRYTLATHPPHDVQSMPEYADGSFDVVVVDNVLEHVERPWLAESEIRRVLAQGGLCVAMTPGLYPVHPSPIDCWRILPDGYRALFPALRWTTFDVGMWGNLDQLRWELEMNGAFPDGPPLSTVAAVASTSPAYRDGCDGRFPLMVWWVGAKR